MHLYIVKLIYRYYEFIWYTGDDFVSNINEKSKTGSGGIVTRVYADLLHEMWSGNTSCAHPHLLKVFTNVHVYNVHNPPEKLLANPLSCHIPLLFNISSC